MVAPMTESNDELMAAARAAAEKAYSPYSKIRVGAILPSALSGCVAPEIPSPDVRSRPPSCPMCMHDSVRGK